GGGRIYASHAVITPPRRFDNPATPNTCGTDPMPDIGSTRMTRFVCRIKHSAKEKPSPFPVRVDQDKAPGGDLLLHGRATLPSAHARFTSEFGMGSGGTTPLWPPGKGWEQR